MGQDEIRCKITHDALTISAGGSSISDVIRFESKVPAGFFSLQVLLVGDGIAKIEYLLSNNGVKFLTPTNAEDIKTILISSSGPGGDGEDMYSFFPMVSTDMKIKVTETGGVDPITITAILAYQ